MLLSKRKFRYLLQKKSKTASFNTQSSNPHVTPHLTLTCHCQSLQHNKSFWFVGYTNLQKIFMIFLFATQHVQLQAPCLAHTHECTSIPANMSSSSPACVGVMVRNSIGLQQVASPIKTVSAVRDSKDVCCCTHDSHRCLCHA